MNEEKDFSEFLRERIKHHNISLRRLSEMTGISVPHLEGLLRGELEELPSAPYLRGYLQRLGEALDFDAEVWWLRFKQSGEVRSSGAEDELPRNRFALRPGRTYGWAIAAGVIILLYFGLRYAKIFGQPILIISNPAEAVVRVEEPSLLISGQTKGGDQVFVNSEQVPFGADGGFEKSVLLAPGLNTVEIQAKKFLGGETRIMRQVIYEPAAGAPAASGPGPSSTPSSTAP